MTKSSMPKNLVKYIDLIENQFCYQFELYYLKMSDIGELLEYFIVEVIHVNIV